MPNETFEMHGGSQDGRVFEFVNPFRPLTFSMDGHERYCLRPDNRSFGLVAPDAELVIHKDEKDVRLGTLDIPDDGSVEPTDALDDESGMASTAEYIGELRADCAAKDAEIARLKAENAESRRLGRAEAAEIITRMNPSVFINDCSGTRDDDDFWLHKKIAELLDTGSAESLIDDQLHAMVEAEASAMELREEVARLKAQRDASEELVQRLADELCVKLFAAAHNRGVTKPKNAALGHIGRKYGLTKINGKWERVK